jgi:hypothetical protein
MNSFKKMMNALIARNRLLETLATLKINNGIERKCIIIQKKAKIFIHNNRLRRLKRYLSTKIIQKQARVFLQNITEMKKEQLHILLKKYVKTQKCRKMFQEKKAAAIIIQYHFRKSYKNSTYSQKCRLIREIICLKDIEALNCYFINDLKKKIRKSQQINRKTAKQWHRKKNFIDVLNNIDEP